MIKAVSDFFLFLCCFINLKDIIGLICWFTLLCLKEQIQYFDTNPIIIFPSTPANTELRQTDCFYIITSPRCRFWIKSAHRYSRAHPWLFPVSQSTIDISIVLTYCIFFLLESTIWCLMYYPSDIASCQHFVGELLTSSALESSLTFSDRLVMMLMPFLFPSTSLTFVPIFPVIYGPLNAMPCTSTGLSGDL